MHEPCGDIARGERRGRAADKVEQSQRIVAVLAVQIGQRVTGQRADSAPVIQVRQPLECTDADMTVVEPGQYRRSGWRWLVAALQLLACFEQRETFRRVDPQRFEHLGREHLAHAALECQPTVAAPAPRGSPAALGAQVEQPPMCIA